MNFKINDRGQMKYLLETIKYVVFKVIIVQLIHTKKYIRKNYILKIINVQIYL